MRVGAHAFGLFKRSISVIKYKRKISFFLWEKKNTEEKKNTDRINKMKVLQTNRSETVICDDECGDKNAVTASSHQKLNDIQELLKSHSVTNKSEW